MVHEQETQLAMREVTSAEASAFVAVAVRFGDVETSETKKKTERLLNTSRHFVISDQKGDIVGYSIKPCGNIAFITAAAELRKTKFDLTALIDALVCEQAQGFEQVAFRTNRVGLMRKTAKLGYQRDGNILSKYL